MERLESLDLKLGKERVLDALVFRHRADLYHNDRLYLEAKVILKPERVKDHDKRMYQAALAAFDLKVRRGGTFNTNRMRLVGVPCVAFALAIPAEAPDRGRESAENKMSPLLNYYMDACCLSLFDCALLKRRDDPLGDRRLSLEVFLKTIADRVSSHRQPQRGEHQADCKVYGHDNLLAISL